MAASIEVRRHIAAAQLGGMKRRCADGDQVRRLMAIAPILNDEQHARLVDQLGAGPIAAVHGVVRWRLIDLTQRVWAEFGLSLTRYTLSRAFRARVG